MISANTLKGVLRSYFTQQPVKRAYVFGSVAREEADDQSDIDILVEFDKGATLFDQARMSWQLEERLHRKVDLVSDSGLSPHIRPFIYRDRILIYEK
jgi:hypothetical protein